MKGAPQGSRPVSIHLERHCRFVERRFDTPTASVGKNGTPRLAPSDPHRERSVVLPFQRHDEDE